MPTKTSIAGCVIERAQRGATSAMKRARPTDSGVETTAARAITASVPAMNGSRPKITGDWLVLSGCETGSKIDGIDTPECRKSCVPFQAMKPRSKATMRTTKPAAMRVNRLGRSSRSRSVTGRSMAAESASWAFVTSCASQLRGRDRQGNAIGPGRSRGRSRLRRSCLGPSGGVEQAREEVVLDVRAEDVVEEGLRQARGLALGVHVAEGLQDVGVVLHVVDRGVDA